MFVLPPCNPLHAKHYLPRGLKGKAQFISPLLLSGLARLGCGRVTYSIPYNTSKSVVCWNIKVLVHYETEEN